MDFKEHKAHGNALFKEAEFALAQAVYTTCLADCGELAPSDRAIILCNRAACGLALKDFSIVVSDCLECLNLDPLSIKGHYRCEGAWGGREL